MEYLSFIWKARAAGSITDATPLSEALVNILNFLLSIAGVVGIIGIVIAGTWYLTAEGDERRIRLAKQAALACVIGTVIAFSALIFLSQIGSWFA